MGWANGSDTAAAFIGCANGSAAAGATPTDADMELKGSDTAPPPPRGLHSFPFELNLSYSVHRITQLNS